MILPYISSGASLKAIWLLYDFDIFSIPSVPSNNGLVIITWGIWPYSRWRSLPTRRLNFWSVPPNSTSAFNSTESIPWANG